MRYRAFSLVELLVVISVTVALTAMLMPALRQVHENAHRVVCLSHLQQLGCAFSQYSWDHNDRLPYSAALHQDQRPQDLMISRRPGEHGGWDGLGILFDYDYCGAPECFYCPSHHGSHPFERYVNRWTDPGQSQIVTNYHYAGDVTWDPQPRRRDLTKESHSLVLATDGLRTARDFNHFSGMNVLRGDGSARWQDDTQDVLSKLPPEENMPPEPQYTTLWDELATQN